MLFEIGAPRTPQISGGRYQTSYIQRSNTWDGNPPRLMEFGSELWSPRGLVVGLSPQLTLPHRISLLPAHYANHEACIAWLRQKSNLVWEAYLTPDETTHDMRLTVALDDASAAAHFVLSFM